MKFFSFSSKSSSIVAALAAAAGLLCASSTATHAATVIENYSNTLNVLIPDNNPSGIADTINVSTTMISLNSVTVTLNTTGGWGGDLYAYLHHDGGTTILLNRPGRTAANLAGSVASVITLTLDDAAATDVHTVDANSASISGTFQPDGRSADPSVVLDTSPRTSTLADFVSSSPGGDWSIFIADTAGGDEATLVSWGITLNGNTIPEPTVGILSLLALCCAFRRRRTR